MISITCDNCGSEKRQVNSTQHEWILGWDLQSESQHAVQRSIRFLDHWDDRRVCELGAIHLCSAECRDEYIGKSKAA